MIGETPIARGGDLRRALRELDPGETARLTLVRPPDGATVTATVRLGEAETQ